jgi:hypothetical protein
MEADDNDVIIVRNDIMLAAEFRKFMFIKMEVKAKMKMKI